jgi:hypothetical protein
MAHPFRALSGLFSALPGMIGLSGAFAPNRRKTTRLEDLPHAIRYDIGVTDTSPVVRGCPRHPKQF